MPAASSAALPARRSARRLHGTAHAGVSWSAVRSRVPGQLLHVTRSRRGTSAAPSSRSRAAHCALTLGAPISMRTRRHHVELEVLARHNPLGRAAAECSSTGRRQRPRALSNNLD
eukprot:682837-Pyramimonas_sp.AAC.1